MLWRAILKEIGGRMQNAAGSINSSNNMYAGSKNNAPSEKMLGMAGGISGLGNALGKMNFGGSVGADTGMDASAMEGAADVASAAS